jgi:small subunit ribosomal protein S2
MAVISMKALLETGVHFGHRTRKWNPRMKPFIFTERNGIHIIDLQQTLESLEAVYALIRDEVSSGGSLLFVGTKRQAQETIQTEAARCGMPYVNARWLGGTLTNWRTIRSRIDELDALEKRRDSGQFEHLTKKEALILERKIERLQDRLGGIRNMRTLPALLFVVDVKREETSIHEANLLDIGVIALVDTNCDPRGVDYVIPSNDDAIRAIKLLTSKVADAVLEGKALRKEDVEEEPSGEAERQVAATLDLSDEELLGEATLAKLQSGAFGEGGGQAIADADTEETKMEEPKPAEPEDELVEADEGEDDSEAEDEYEADDEDDEDFDDDTEDEDEG